MSWIKVAKVCTSRVSTQSNILYYAYPFSLFFKSSDRLAKLELNGSEMLLVNEIRSLKIAYVN
jgi:hypothetical protein